MARRRRPGRIDVAPGELELLAMLWDRGPLTLGESHEAFGRYGRPVSYPTIQTRLNRLVDKGLVVRSNERPARYSALVTSEQVGAGLMDRLLKALGNASPVPLVARLISERPLTSEEVQQLKRLLAAAEKEAKEDEK